jgi:hypothetical protein
LQDIGYATKVVEALAARGLKKLLLWRDRRRQQAYLVELMLE